MHPAPAPTVTRRPRPRAAEGSRREPVLLGADDDSPRGIVRGAMSRVPGIVVTDGRPPLRSAAGERAMLQREGWR